MKKPAERFFYKANRLQQLRGFCRTVELGSATRAARSLGVSQSSVSLQISSLERDLGVPLFLRAGPKLTVTGEGRLLYEIAVEPLHGINQLFERFSSAQRKLSEQSIDIAANSTSLSYLLPEILRVFFQKQNRVNVKIHFAEQAEAIEKLLDRRVALAILPRREHQPFPKSVEYIPIFTFAPVLVTRSDHPLAGKRRLKLADIAKFDFSLPAEDLRVIPDLHESLRRTTNKGRLKVEFENWETTRKFIEAGLVISISSNVILTKGDSLVGTSLSHLFPSVSYGAVLLRGAKMSTLTEDIIAIAKTLAVRRAQK